jgi:phage-related tail fiber protein
MGNLIDQAQWQAVPHFEADAVLTGGPDCPDNIPIQALANRTTFLKQRLDLASSTLEKSASIDYVKQAIANVLNGAPGALDTLKELADALGNDANFAATITKALAGKAAGASTLEGYGIVDALPLKPLLGANVDLDGMISTGWYHQSLNINATSGSNYPAPTAGMLSVYAMGSMVYQQYLDYQGKRIYWRVKYNDTWSAWQSTATVAEQPALWDSRLAQRMTFQY